MLMFLMLVSLLVACMVALFYVLRVAPSAPAVGVEEVSIPPPKGNVWAHFCLFDYFPSHTFMGATKVFLPSPRA